MASCVTFSQLAKDRITFEQPNDTDDGYGGRVRAWTSVGDFNPDFNSDYSSDGCWAIVYPMSGGERFAQGGIQTSITHKFVIRYKSGFKSAAEISDYRISFDGRYFAVKYLRNLSKDMKTHGNDFQEIMTEERGPDADIV